MKTRNLLKRAHLSVKRTFIGSIVSVLTLMLLSCIPDGYDGSFGAIASDGAISYSVEWDGTKPLKLQGWLRNEHQIIKIRDSYYNPVVTIDDAAAQGGYFMWTVEIPVNDVLWHLCQIPPPPQGDNTLLLDAMVEDTSTNKFSFAAAYGTDPVTRTVFIHATNPVDCEGVTYEEKDTYYDVDPLGSPVAATDETGALLWRAQYTPFGQRINSSSSLESRIAFTGAQQDDLTGLIDLGARQYNPDIGRFYGIDPVGVRDGDPHSFNRYAYANNSPYRYTDPTGRIPLETIWDAANVAMGVEAFVDNVSAGNWWDAAADGLGIVIDSAAVIVPYAPGGVGTIIRTARAADKVVDATQTVQRVEKAIKSQSKAWKKLGRGKGGRRTTGSGRKQRHYEWDHTHGDIEVYDSNGRHLGSAHPDTGELYKPEVAGRKIDL
jgi:RHS repeat-associated protein